MAFDSIKIAAYCAKLPDWQLQQLVKLVGSEQRKRKQQWELAEYQKENPTAKPTQIK